MSLWRDDTELIDITIRSVCVDSTTPDKTPIPSRLRVALGGYGQAPVRQEARPAASTTST